MRRTRTRSTQHVRLSLLIGVSALLLGATLPRNDLPESALAVYDGERWVAWWRSDSAPREWKEDSLFTRVLQWQPLQRGVDLAHLRLAGSGEAWRVGVILVRVDPALISFTLTAKPRQGGGESPWTIADAPSTAAIALNAGQFINAVPWGWVVRRQRERRRPGTGPLAHAVIIPYDGRIRIIPPESIAVFRNDARVREAFQSYPALLVHDGQIPRALETSGQGVDVAHRDARLVFATLRDGRVLIALTRFEGLGGVLSHLPFGLTAPETAALLGAVGAQRAVMLDGGISAQLQVRDSLGNTQSWRGLRRVPLGLIGTRSPVIR